MEPYTIERIPVDTLSAADIANTFVGAGRAAIFTNVLSCSPWAKCVEMGKHRFYANHPEVSNLEAEIIVQQENNIQSSYDFEMENISAEAAMDLLTLRMTEDTSCAKTGTDKPGEVLYVKLSLTSCTELMQKLDLQSFANPALAEESNDSGKFTPSQHPLLIGPGSYFCWAYIGEASTGSKTHVDVASSDAFLTVLTGKKEWAMVHPLDKHLVTNSEGKMADLFNVDHEAFPEAKRARLCRFIQNAGECVFVPSEAPHCVRNIESSFSITYNFALPSTAFRYRAAMDKMMGPLPTVATVDLVVFCPKLKQRATLRSYVKDLPAPLPVTDYDCRMRLSQLHAALGVYGRYLDREHTNAIPVGFEVCRSSHRVIYYYRMDQPSDFSALFVGSKFFSCESYVSDEAVQPPSANCFSSTTSHFGHVPSFPPLRVLINQPLFSPSAFRTCAISNVISSSAVTAEGNNGGGQEEDEALKITSSSDARRVLPCSGTDGRPRQWHYARFPFKLPPSSQLMSSNVRASWCHTYLFYSSHDIHGPVSLHPLLVDSTLQGRSGLFSNATDAKAVTETYSPHFEALLWREDPLQVHSEKTSSNANNAATGRADTEHSSSPLLFDLGDDLVGSITKGLVLAGDGALAELLSVAALHGLRPPGCNNYQSDEKKVCGQDGGYSIDELLSMGLEKVLILALYFSTVPRTVGFAYSHTFSTVEEPHTICLTSSAADTLLKPLRYDDAAIALSAFCNAVDPPSTSSGKDLNGGAMINDAYTVDSVSVPISAEDLQVMADSLTASFPFCFDVVGKVRAIKERCKERIS